VSTLPDESPDAQALLGGASRVRTRVRGFATWSPKADTLALLDQVRGVLDEYEDYLPLTIRQIFYRLVGAHEYENTERAYERLSEHLNRARRARMIPMGVIRDDGGTILVPTTWRDADEYLAAVREEAKKLLLDRSIGQPTRLVVRCEATGMAPQLERVADPFGVMVMSSGGFDSLTKKTRIGRRRRWISPISTHPARTTFLAEMEDVEAFARVLGGEVTFTRLAVTRDQISRYRLDTAPPKPTDNRAFHGETCSGRSTRP
jgi:hypothetical protein